MITNVSVSAVTTEPDHFFTCFRQVSVEGDMWFRKLNTFWIFEISVDGIRPKPLTCGIAENHLAPHLHLIKNKRAHCIMPRSFKNWINFPQSRTSNLSVRGNTRLCLGNTFLPCFRWRFVPETSFFRCSLLFIALFQHSLFLIFLCYYRTGKCVVTVFFSLTPTISMTHYFLLVSWILHKMIMVERCRVTRQQGKTNRETSRQTKTVIDHRDLSSHLPSQSGTIHPSQHILLTSLKPLLLRT